MDIFFRLIPDHSRGLAVALFVPTVLATLYLSLANKGRKSEAVELKEKTVKTDNFTSESFWNGFSIQKNYSYIVSNEFTGETLQSLSGIRGICVSSKKEKHLFLTPNFDLLGSLDDSRSHFHLCVYKH